MYYVSKTATRKVRHGQSLRDKPLVGVVAIHCLTHAIRTASETTSVNNNTVVGVTSH
jgi:hypothetical protein